MTKDERELLILVGEVCKASLANDIRKAERYAKTEDYAFCRDIDNAIGIKDELIDLIVKVRTQK